MPISLALEDFRSQVQFAANVFTCEAFKPFDSNDLRAFEMAVCDAFKSFESEVLIQNIVLQHKAR